MSIFKKASVLPITRSVYSQYDVLDPLYGKDPGSPMPSFEKMISEYGANELADLEMKLRSKPGEEVAIPVMDVYYLIKRIAERAAMLNEQALSKNKKRR